MSKPDLRVLICGSRDWSDQRIVDVLVEGLIATAGIEDRALALCQGDAKGADACAKKWADVVHVEDFPAKWGEHDWIWCPGAWCRDKKSTRDYCVGAGPRRNDQMLTEFKPHVVIGFKDGYKPGSGGTENMIEIAKAAGVKTYVVSHG